MGKKRSEKWDGVLKGRHEEGKGKEVTGGMRNEKQMAERRKKGGIERGEGKRGMKDEVTRRERIVSKRRKMYE